VGTLDPDADGVLPILVGQATKLQDYLLEMPKVYSFEFKLESPPIHLMRLAAW
jgi:tRNA U55 pseudouridine synthase TruB